MSALELKVPPLALVLVFVCFMWLISGYEGSPALPLPWHVGIAVLCWIAGVAVILAGMLAFRRAKTTVNPFTPEAATTMVDSGVYRFSRNPMYLGFLLALIGWAAYLSHLFAFALLPLFVLYMNRFQIEPEERALSSKFGSQFHAYAASVRRWV
jgi:protein-S-isoprenylcysteine O-methyltransferase Ste14